MENNTNVTLTEEKATSSSLWSKINFIKSTVVLAIATMINQCLCVPTYAALNIQPVSIGPDVSVQGTANMILGLILTVTTFIGGAMAIWGMVMFGLALKNDEPDSKQKALMTIFAGIVVLGLKSIVPLIFK